jgi:hypothetical protein
VDPLQSLNTAGGQLLVVRADSVRCCVGHLLHDEGRHTPHSALLFVQQVRGNYFGPADTRLPISLGGVGEGEVAALPITLVATSCAVTVSTHGARAALSSSSPNARCRHAVS